MMEIEDNVIPDMRRRVTLYELWCRKEEKRMGTHASVIIDLVTRV